MTRKEAEVAARDALATVPEGVDKDSHLPFVEAAVRYWDLCQAEALAADDTRRSFEVAEQQLKYKADYARLAGRPYGAA